MSIMKHVEVKDRNSDFLDNCVLFEFLQFMLIFLVIVESSAGNWHTFVVQRMLRSNYSYSCQYNKYDKNLVPWPKPATR